MNRTLLRSQCTDPRSPYEWRDVYEPHIDGILYIVDPRHRVVFRNLAARPGANAIQLI